jgi:molybdenum cofactor guanylyltransferase
MNTQPHHVGVTAAILAGGLARRMDGKDKARLAFAGRPLIEHQVSALRQITESIIVVGGDPARFTELGIHPVPDAFDQCGALGGIYSAIIASDHPRTLVVACDMPFLSVPVLRRLVRPSGPEVDVVMPRSLEGPEPLCAVYAARCAEPIRRRIERGLLKAADVSADVRVEEVDAGELATYDPDGLMFVNVNSPHDYERAKMLMGRGPESRAMRADPITDDLS